MFWSLSSVMYKVWIYQCIDVVNHALIDRPEPEHIIFSDIWTSYLGHVVDTDRDPVVSVEQARGA
ncbi:hypothetical protein C8R41DRAFT_523248 [Lentinula lateritia]|uniref:Uncharacterized protein n=1 Tax=Lentinula lateritia TaxID=40482 RepID=A0ABQ8V6Q6_9AGAR|nr:hypothetical protein C8R41DRAFT_523248 [Lentinula lateritia]